MADLLLLNVSPFTLQVVCFVLYFVLFFTFVLPTIPWQDVVFVIRTYTDGGFSW